MAEIGIAGQKYGLIKPTPKKQQPTARLELHEDDDDEIVDLESNKGQGQLRQKQLQEAEKQRKLRLVERMQQKALEEDPTIFDYDGVYDNIKQQTQPNFKARAQKQTVEQEKKPRYIQALLQKAEERKVVDDLRFERKIRKEAAADEEEFGDLPKFVTQSYIKKMEENKRAREEMARRDARDEDPSTKKNLSSFYTNLLVNNVAFGTGPKADAPKAPPPKEETPSTTATSTSTSSSTKELSAAEKARREKMREEAMARFGGGSDTTSTASAPSQKRKDAPALTEEKSEKEEAEQTKKQKVELSSQPTSAETTATTTDSKPTTTTTTASAPPAGVDRDAKANEARMRFLQRKKEAK